MKNLLLLLTAFLLCISKANSEEMYLPELENLFGSDLIVDASYMRVDGPDYFYIKINEVLKGEKYGLKKGDYLRMKQLKTDGCGFPFVHYPYKRNRYYLKKNPSEWSIRYMSAQSIAQLDRFETLWNKDENGNAMSLNASIKEFLTCYAYNEKSREYETLKSENQLKEIAAHNILVKTFEASNRQYLGSYDEPTLLEASKFEEPLVTEIMYCDFLPQPAKSNLSTEEESDYLSKNENPLQEHGIEGRVIVKCLINESGKVSVVEVLKSVHPTLDSLAIEKMNKMPQWQPAIDHRGNTRACYYNFPITYRLDKIQ